MWWQTRNIPVGMVTNHHHVNESFSLDELRVPHRNHHAWSRVIYALESVHETNLPALPVPFRQFFWFDERAVYRLWPSKKQAVAQFVIPKCYIPKVLKLVHGGVIAEHPGKERTLTAAHTSYFLAYHAHRYWRVCLQVCEMCSNQGGGASTCTYTRVSPTWPALGWAIDLLQLSASHQGSKYLLVWIDHLSQYVVQAPLKDKSTKSVAHALVTPLLCPYTTPRVLLSDNGTESRNQLLEEISKQFRVNHCFTVSCHPASNSLLERANRKILEVLHPVISELLETWEGWLPHITTSINSSVCGPTGQSPQFIIFGVEKLLPFDLLSSSHTSVNNVEDYVKYKINLRYSQVGPRQTAVY